MTTIEERLNILEANVESIARFLYSMQQTAMNFSLQPPTPRLPFEPEAQPPLLTPPVHLHFGLDATQRAHWADVYSRLLAERKLHADEVTSANFTYLMCGAGTAPQVEVCGETAVVRYSYWRKREGLVKCTLLVTKNADSVSFGKERKEVLIVRG